MQLYNTLTREKEDLQPIMKDLIRIYSCGPTVYAYSHIGNMRTYIFADILKKALRYNQYQVKHVMNITDVGHLVSDADDGDDKMLATVKKEQKSPYEIAEYYTQVFLADMQKLNIALPDVLTKATDNIAEMIQMVEGLHEKGYAYETSDGIYFDVMKIPNYGKLSRLDLEGQIAGARVEVNTEKRHPADFALWKKAPKNHIMQWDSPWGKGFPGWHIECSAMALKFLGETFDIHTGAIDAIPIHHENEIAQSDAYLGKQAVKMWMHGEFLLVENGKMSKSLGTMYTVSDLEEKGYLPLEYRYFCLNGHYRSKLNFTWKGMKAAKISYKRLLEGVAKHKYADNADDALLRDAVLEFKAQFDAAINDDLNIPKALGIVWTAVKYETKSKSIYQFLLKADEILSLDLQKAELKQTDEGSENVQSEDIPDEIRILAEQRQKARKEKDFQLADTLRDKLDAMGYLLEDTKEGMRIKRK